ncbi:MAG TPA: hypothetical protein VNM72_04190 [Blastocatellia bacterium]|nr:hypothetical protein [Blastocatellia bacterium]
MERMRRWNGFENDTVGPSATGPPTGTGARERRDAKLGPLVREDLEGRSFVPSTGNKGAALPKHETKERRL